MPIRPIEIVKTQEATQLKHIENQRAQHAQEQLSKNFQHMIEQDNIKPVQTTKTENYEYRYDAKEKGNTGYYGSGGKKKDKSNDNDNENKKESKEPSKGGKLDILI